MKPEGKEDGVSNGLPMSTLSGFLVLAVVLYSALTAMVYFGQEHLLFYPRASIPEIESRYRDYGISFKIGGVELHGWFFPTRRERPALIYYGGNGEELSGSIDNLRALGDYNHVIVNYRGYGRSSGSPTEKTLKSDALFILDSLESQGKISLENSFILGRSLGSAIAVHVAANRRTKGLILVSPFDSIEAIASDLYFFLPVRWLIRNPFRSIDYVDRIAVPTLIIKAETDEVVPLRYSDALISAWKYELEVVQLEGTSHNYIQTEEYVNSINRFIERSGNSF